MATVLVAFAIVEGNPTHMSAGNVTSVPPPATELMAPATHAAANTSSSSTLRSIYVAAAPYGAPAFCRASPDLSESPTA